MKAVRHRRKRRVKQVKHKLKNGESKKEKGNDKKGKNSVSRHLISGARCLVGVKESHNEIKSIFNQ